MDNFSLKNFANDELKRGIFIRGEYDLLIVDEQCRRTIL